MTGQPDYDTLLDAEVRAYIARCDALYPPDAVSLDIRGQREVYDRMAAAFRQPRPEAVDATDETIAGIPCRRYRRDGPQGPKVLYFHGGGFVVGGLDSHDDVCAEICDRTGLEVVSVDYRLAPEHVHPAAYDDCLAVARQIGGLGPILLAGDSAGGALAASVAHGLRGSAIDCRGMVLIYPGLSSDMTKGSYLTHAEAPQLTLRDTQFYKRMRYGGAPPTDDPTGAVLTDTDFSGLPPTIIFSAECDPLSDDGQTYRDRIVAAGGTAEWIREDGLVHGYLRARTMSSRAAASFDRIVSAIARLGAG